MIAALLVLALAQEPADFPVQRYAVDTARSSIRFEGSSTLHGFGGRARSIGGEAFADPRRPVETGGARLWVDVGSMDTEDSKRDRDMRKALDAGRHPRVVFRLKELDGELRGWSGRLQAYGTFEVKGVRRGRVLQVAVDPAGEDGFRVRGRTELSLAEHGIDPPSVLFVKVRDKVEVRFDVVFAAEPGEALPAQWCELSLSETRADVPHVGPRARSQAAPPRTSRVWLREHVLYWLRGDGTLALASETGLTLWDPSGERLELPSAAEAAFADLRRELERASRGRDDERLAVLDRAPSGAAELQRRGDVVSLEIGGASWLELRGASGDAPFARLLGALEGVPGGVRERLGELRGLPREVDLRVALPDTSRTGWRMVLGEASEGSLPAWIVERARSAASETSPAGATGKSVRGKR